MSTERISCRDVRRVFANLAKDRGWRSAKTCTPEWDGSYFLEEWSPGDGMTRYRVMRGSGRSAETYGPFGSLYWLGARQAYEHLVTARQV